MLMTKGWVGGLRKHPIGRVDQLEDRYLGMVEAPSSNLGTSTSESTIDITEVDRAAHNRHAILRIGCWLGTSTIDDFV
jgi:hypothetical protein